MKNRIAQLLATLSLATAALAVHVPAQADLFADRSLSVGLQSGGPSVKMPITEDIKGQLLLDPGAVVSSAEVRGLRSFGSSPYMDFYGYGSVGMWTWDGSYYYGSETAFGAGVGVGIDYDIRQAMPDLPPIFLSAELGTRFVSFDNYSSFDSMNVDLGIHYQF